MSGNIKSFRITEGPAGLQYEYVEEFADGETKNYEGSLIHAHLEDAEIVNQISKFISTKEQRRMKK